MITNPTKELVKKKLTDLLNECLSFANQEYSFEIKEIDLVDMKCQIEFNIVIAPEDDYIGFQGY